MSRTALIAGASGLVGSALLTQLLADATWDRVISIGRRRVEVTDPKLEQRIVELGHPADGPELPRIDDAFCCLGTTIKKAGSQDAFRAVDHDAVLKVAAAAQRAGATQFLHVTALGAAATSRVFYNRVKGETERDVAALGITTTVAFRPSILDGDRPESRPGEQIGLIAMRTLAPVLGRLRPTRADDLARAMIEAARQQRPGDRIVAAGDIPRAH